MINKAEARYPKGKSNKMAQWNIVLYVKSKSNQHLLKLA